MRPRRALGRMRHRLALMATVRNRDAGGGTARADTVIGTVAARITVASARERAAYGQLQERVAYIATIRFRSDLDQGQTVVWLPAGAADATVGSATLPTGTALYVLTAVDADPDMRPGEFMTLALEERSTI